MQEGPERVDVAGTRAGLTRMLKLTWPSVAALLRDHAA